MIFGSTVLEIAIGVIFVYLLLSLLYIEKARTNIEEWYNGMMDRVSGWYRRRTAVIMLILGFVVAAVVNADTISIATAGNTADPRRVPEGVLPWLLKVCGILLTGVAISQGSPFWFDLISRFVTPRSTVKPPERSR